VAYFQEIFPKFIAETGVCHSWEELIYTPECDLRTSWHTFGRFVL